MTCDKGRYGYLSNWDWYCAGCNIGHYQPNDNVYVTACTACAPGSYEREYGSFRCTTCGSGDYCPDYGRTKRGDTCPEGSYANVVGASSCNPCPVGHVCRWDWTNGWGGKSMQWPEPCKAGKYQGALRGTVCYECSVGQFSGAGASVCSTCSAGSYSGVAAASCTGCPAGTYSTDRRTCTDCGGHEWSDSGATACIACSNKPTTNAYYIQKGTTNNGCLWSCEGGYEKVNGQCQACAFGYFSERGMNQCQVCTFDKINAISDRCPFGNYAAFDRITCKRTTCTPCTNADAASLYGQTDTDRSYFYLSKITTANTCFTKSCGGCSAGMTAQGCGGAYQYTWCDPCSPDVRQTAGTNGKWYTTGCTAAPCKLCPVGTFNEGCPWYRSDGEGQCATCTPAIANGAFVAITASMVHYANECPFACNAGYYASGRTCVSCVGGDSSSCVAGTFRPTCTTATAVGCTGQCAGKPAVGSQWYTARAGYDVGACVWVCAIGYYFDTSYPTVCTECKDMAYGACDAGYQAVYTCKTAAMGNTRPNCQTCPTPSNAIAIKTGLNKCEWTCNTGFWAETTTTICKSWSAVSICDGGQYIAAGTATTDRKCAVCSGVAGTNRAYTQNACDWVCKAGSTLNANGVCVACNGGYYKATAGNGPCTLCPAGQYQPYQALSLPLKCTLPPTNAGANPTQTDFVCNGGFERYLDLECKQCIPALANHISVTYTTDKCDAAALLCNPGFYRNRLPAGCVVCPAVSNAASVTAAATSAAIQAAMGVQPSTDSNDELNTACPGASTCKAGYYHRLYASASGKSSKATCDTCGKAMCAIGQLEVGCTGNSFDNTCSACDPSKLYHNAGYIFGVNCENTCPKGAYEHSFGIISTNWDRYGNIVKTGINREQIMCICCAAGYFKSEIGTANTCTLCPVGTYASVACSWICKPCPVGTYGAATGLTICASCAPGLNGPAGMSVPCKTDYDMVIVASGVNIRQVNMATNAISSPITGFSGTALCSISPQMDYLLYNIFGGNTIYKYTYATQSHTLSGGTLGQAGYVEGFAGISQLNYIASMSISADGSYALVADTNNNAIRKLNLINNELSTLAGGQGSGRRNGIGTEIQFVAPFGVTLSYDNTFALVTESGKRLRKIDLTTNPVTSSLIGGDDSMDRPTSNNIDGIGNAARFKMIVEIAISSDNKWAFLSQMVSGEIRMIDIQNRETRTMVGRSGSNFPTGMVISPVRDRLFVATGDGAISKIAFANGDMSYATANSAVSKYITLNSDLVLHMEMWRCGLKGYGALDAVRLCSQCPSGMYSKGYGLCVLCEAGSASGMGASACTPCTGNTFSGVSGASTCTACPVGGQGDVTRCLSGPGYYQTAAAAIVACPAGTYNTAIGSTKPLELDYTWDSFTDKGDTFCGLPAYRGAGGLSLYCWSGSTWMISYQGIGAGWGWWYNVPCTIEALVNIATNVKYCYLCPAGTYAAAAGQTACTTCPLDSYCSTTAITPCPAATPYTIAVGSTALTQCLATLGKPCRPGYFWFFVEQRCVACVGATYCVNDAITACTPLKDGAWFAEPKASTASGCFYKAITTAAVACPANTVETPNSKPTHIWQCRAGAGFYFIPGIHTVGQVCPDGYYCPQGTLIPIECAAPAVCATVGAWQIANQCPKGSAAILPACQTCPIALPAFAAYVKGGACEFCCNTGYMLTASTACTPTQSSAICALSTQYMPQPPSSACTITSTPVCLQCPVLAGVTLTANKTYRLEEKKGSLWGTDACAYECQLGWLLDASTMTCKACAAGTYQAQRNAKTCTSCPFATFSVAGASVCQSCGPYGFPQADKAKCVCVGGSYADAILTGGKCVACGLGSVTSAGTCFPCPAGKVCSLNSNLSVAITTSVCPTFFDGKVAAFRPNGKSTCVACPLGSIASGTGESARCVPCPQGTYQTKSTCTPCPINTYGANQGSYSPCVACTSPFVAPIGSAACVCPANYYRSSSTTCTACRATCMAGATIVRTCPMGSVSDVSLCACTVSGDGMVSACNSGTCPIVGGCNCAQNFYYNAKLQQCVECRTQCPSPATLSGGCQKGTSIQDSTLCLCPSHMYWMGTGCARCKRCAGNATLIVACPSGGVRDTAVCTCNAGFVGNGVSVCKKK